MSLAKNYSITTNLTSYLITFAIFGRRYTNLHKEERKSHLNEYGITSSLMRSCLLWKKYRRLKGASIYLDYGKWGKSFKILGPNNRRFCQPTEFLTKSYLRIDTIFIHLIVVYLAGVPSCLDCEKSRGWTGASIISV